MGTSKSRLLALMRIFEECTDDQRGLTMPQIIEKLEEEGISAERKALYRDISALVEGGFAIEKFNCAPVEYRLVKRHFSFTELQLLVDAVQSSRFLTQDAVNALTQGVEQLCSVEQAKYLRRHIHVGNRVRMQNESVFGNIDVVNEALNTQRKIEFRYFKYDCAKRAVARRDGAVYCETPVQLVFSEGFYYMIAYNDKHQDFATYRLDRMSDVSVSVCPAMRNDAIAHFDVTEYEARAFGMYAGEPLYATLLVSEEAMGAIVDRFGKDVDSIDKENGTAEVRVRIMESPVFYGWLTQFGASVRVVSPRSLAKNYQEYLKNLIAQL